MDTKNERERRRRVVHGWAFREYNDQETTAIREYLATGCVMMHLPQKYVKLNETVR